MCTPCDLADVNPSLLSQTTSRACASIGNFRRSNLILPAECQLSSWLINVLFRCAMVQNVPTITRISSRVDERRQLFQWRQRINHIPEGGVSAPFSPVSPMAEGDNKSPSKYAWIPSLGVKSGCSDVSATSKYTMRTLKVAEYSERAAN